MTTIVKSLVYTALICSFVKEEFREVIVKIICSFIPERMFTVTDVRGRTPLHLAVEYERCCETQVSIVNELLRQGPKALEVELSTSYSRWTLSVYQYHDSSRKQTDNKRRHAEGQERKTTTGSAIVETDGRLRSENSKDTIKKVGFRIEKGNMGPPPLRDRGEPAGPGIKRRDSSRVRSTPQDREIPASPLNRRQVGSSAAEGQALAPTQNTIDLLRQRDEQREKAAKVISEQLKLLYIRMLRPERVSHCLHVQDERGQ